MEDSQARGRQRLIEIILIIVLSAVAFLPHLTRATVYRDDWYYVMDRTIGGPGVFQEMFSIDRPARGPLFEAYYQLFGFEPLPYHITSYLWRLLGGLSALYLFNLLWPNQKRMAFVMALLFTLFPGYSRWLEGIENQPRMLSSFLEVLSIALTLQAIKSKELLPKAAAWIGSILTGWAYIALLDFAIGMEFFRLACVFVLVSRDLPGASLVKKGIATLRAWAIAIFIPGIFLIWRLFIFHNERPTTDVGLQLSFLVKSPLQTGFWWLIRIFQSTVNITVLPWAAPLFQSLFGLTLSAILIGIFIAAASAACFFMAYRWIDNNSNPVPTEDCRQVEAILLGLSGVVIGVMPVIMANRYATMGNYSHYGLPASLASAVLAGGVVFSISSRRIRLGVMSALVLFSVLSHYVIASNLLREEKTVANFWQQVVWRAPGIQAGTTLMVNYPGVDFGQDIDTISGPANYIYFSQQTNQIPATYPLSALEQGEYSTKDVLSDPAKTYRFEYRTHNSQIDYSKLLVISQPSEDSCVHVIDNRWPLQSEYDGYAILLAQPYSKIDRVVTTATPPQPSKSMFGPELAHNWCYYFQKAELAQQSDDWQQIVTLGEHVWKNGIHPQDSIEWMPFLQAYAVTGDTAHMNDIAKQTKRETYFKKQACQTLNKMNTGAYPMQPQVLDEANRLFCEE